MTVSIPSKEIYSLDVPEVKSFAASFQYNYFVTDECLSETGGVPTKLLQKKSSEADEASIQKFTRRVPRMVVFNFSMARLAQVSRVSSENTIRSNLTTNTQHGSLISDNLDKIVSEDYFSSNNFVAVNFNDGEIDDKIFHFVSGSYLQHTLDNPGDQNVSGYVAAQRLHALLPEQIKPHFLFKSLANNARSSGVRLHDKNGTRIFDDYFRRLKNVAVNTQINSRLFYELTDRTIKDPNSQFTSDLHNLNKFASNMKSQLATSTMTSLSENDYKAFVPFIDVRIRDTSSLQEERGAEIVGYVIDKLEIAPDGSVVSKQPIVIENARSVNAVDIRVRYNAQYAYSIRTIAQFTLPVINDETGELATAKILVSSKPSPKVYVSTIETVAPPPPCNLGFAWDYDRINPTTAMYDQFTGEAFPNTGKRGSLMLHWEFPTNSQRDIKKFQVFRRSSIDEPFELIKMYDFDDSAVRFDDNETPAPGLVETLTTPCTFFYDDDFTVDQTSNSKFIYAVASIDAHGYTSNYSAQFEVTFDQFKNSIVKRLISHSGAPKPYPNLYLEADTFVDTIRVSGPSSRRLKLYFNPQFYSLYDDEGKTTNVFETDKTGGSYKFQFINVDNQKMAAVSLNIKDMIKPKKQLAKVEQTIDNTSATPNRFSLK